MVCQQYWRYNRFNSKWDQDYDQGIIFWDLSTSEQIVSYPTIHYKNGAAKNQAVNGRYRETIRIFKNARSYLVDKGAIAGDLAPSYYVECLLYNVPADNYVYDQQDRYANIVNWLADARLAGFQCQNEIQDLFGSNSTQWSQADATAFIHPLIELWNNWYDY